MPSQMVATSHFRFPLSDSHVARVERLATMNTRRLPSAARSSAQRATHPQPNARVRGRVIEIVGIPLRKSLICAPGQNLPSDAAKPAASDDGLQGFCAKLKAHCNKNLYP